LNSDASTDSDDDEHLQWATDRNGNVVAVWMKNLQIYTAHSADNGATWSAAAILNSTAAVDATSMDANPAIATDANGNWVCVWQSQYKLSSETVTDYDIFVARSGDNGAT
jgi:hypothetical protein